MTNSRIFHTRSERQQPLEEPKKSEDAEQMKQPKNAVHISNDKEANSAHKTLVAELEDVDQGSTGAGGLGSSSTRPSISTFLKNFKNKIKIIESRKTKEQDDKEAEELKETQKRALGKPQRCRSVTMHPHTFHHMPSSLNAPPSTHPNPKHTSTINNYNHSTHPMF